VPPRSQVRGRTSVVADFVRARRGVVPSHPCGTPTTNPTYVDSEGQKMETQQERFPRSREGMVLTHFITSSDVERSASFYRDVLGGEIVAQGEPTAVKLANAWVIINVGGGPTDDKPDVILEPPGDSHRTSSFLNIRVADIAKSYAEWKRKGAEFLTPPKQNAREIRCYMRDPDGYLIEVGQTTAPM